ncbi:MAG TPA: nitroreductase [Armatimonadetes bacterium]|nr:nitroreductase [Armatimonadota bacterium]
MDFFETISRRRSVRAFTGQAVEEEKLQRILEAVNAAPSAGDLQAYEVVLVREEETKKALARAAWGQNFIAQAPVVLVFVANPERSSWRYGRRGEELYCLQDATIACTHAHLAATALGLGSVWVGAFQDSAVAQAVGVSPPLRPVAILPLGYPAESPSPTPRRPLNELVHQERL